MFACPHPTDCHLHPDCRTFFKKNFCQFYLKIYKFSVRKLEIFRMKSFPLVILKCFHWSASIWYLSLNSPVVYVCCHRVLYSFNTSLYIYFDIWKAKLKKKKKTRFPFRETQFLKVGCGQTNFLFFFCLNLVIWFNQLWKVDEHPWIHWKVSSHNLSQSYLFYSQGNVELWLGQLLNQVRTSIHSIIRTASVAVSDSDTFKLIEFENTYPGQVGILGIQMLWTKRSEEALKNARSDRKVMYGWRWSWEGSMEDKGHKVL